MFGTMLLSVGNFVLLSVSAARTHARGNLLRLSALSVTLWLTLLSVIGTFVWAMVVYLSTVDTSGALLVEGYVDQYKGRYNVVALVFAPMALALGAIALLHISLMWVEVAHATGCMSRGMASNLARTRRVIYAWEACMVLLGIAGTVAERVTGRSVYGFVLSPLIVFIIASYVYGAVALNALLRKSIRNNKSSLTATNSLSFTSHNTAGSGERFASSRVSSSEQQGPAKSGARASAKSHKSSKSTKAPSPARQKRKRSVKG